MVNEKYLYTFAVIFEKKLFIHKKLLNMKNLSLILTFLVFGFIGLNAQDNPVEIATITVDEFQEKASAYVGQEIYITGICDHVCKHAGKQLQLVGSTPDITMKIKAGEKIGKFQKDIEGDNLKILGLVKESRINGAKLITSNKGDKGECVRNKRLCSFDSLKSSQSFNWEIM